MRWKPQQSLKRFADWKTVTLFLALCFPAYAEQELTNSQLEQWFESEDFSPPVTQPSDGELIFLQNPPREPILHVENTFIIDDTSIEQGWVKFIQCYSNLDAITESEVVYKYQSMRNLEITSTRNIEDAFIQDQSIQIRNASNNASICTSAEVKNLYHQKDHSFLLSSGPYHRRFFDGFFPYHLTLKIRFPEKLNFISSDPRPQQGFNVTTNNNVIHVDTWFEGILRTRFRFAPNKSVH